jgi:hypothetical protein
VPTGAKSATSTGAKGTPAGTGARPTPGDSPAPTGVKGATSPTGTSTGPKGVPAGTGAKPIPDGGPDGGRATRMRNAASGVGAAAPAGDKAAPGATGATAPTGGPPR